MWVVTEVMITVLEVFRHRTARCIAVVTVWRGDVRECEWALVGVALEVTGIWPISEYVMRFQVKVF